MSENKGKRIFVFGLDGATFDIIDKMVAENQLPNIKKLMENGSYGILKSCKPDLSPAAWTSFMTGKHPGKHWILDFFGLKPNSYDLTFFSASYRKAEPIWTTLSKLGKKVCVMNVPLTYPPDKVSGVMISGMDTPSIESDFIYPSSFRHELDEKIGGYVLEMASRDIGKDREKYIKSLFKVTQNRFDVATYLLEKDDWDLFVVVFESTDRVQHNFWKYMDPKHPEYNNMDSKKYGNAIFDTYKNLDSKIGKLTSNLPDHAHIVVLSDHGFGPLYKGVRLNKWLEANHYATYRGRPKRSWKLHMIRNIERRIPKFLKRTFGAVITSRGLINKPDVLGHLDMSKTKVYPIGGNGSLCINLKGRQPEGIVEPGKEYDELRDEIIVKLKDLKDPSTGNRVIDKVMKREEAYSVFPEHTPDIIISWAYGYSFIGESEMTMLGITCKPDDVFVPHRWSGTHRPDGIVIISGEDIKKNYQIKEAEIVDIAPTILALMSASIPDDMDGKVLEEAVEEHFTSSSPITYYKSEAGRSADSMLDEEGYSEEESEQIEDMLRELGYIE